MTKKKPVNKRKETLSALRLFNNTARNAYDMVSAPVNIIVDGLSDALGVVGNSTSDVIDYIDNKINPKLITQSDNFKNWFGDWESDPANASKVIDENGKPLVVYHGSPNEFDVFNPSKKGMLGEGIYVTALPEYAERFRSGNSLSSGTSQGPMYELYADIKNPLVVTDDGTYLYNALSKVIRPGENINDVYIKMLKTTGQPTDEIKVRAEEMGYDGIMTKDKKFIVPFFPNQLKSSTKNSGKFDKNNPSILGKNKTEQDIKDILSSKENYV